MLPTVQPGVTQGSYELFIAYKASGLWNDYHPHALLHGYIAELDPGGCPAK